MQTQLYVHITEPCHEDWSNMTEADKGKFCQSCQKIVVDFSMMTDAEVLNYFNKTSKQTCGRFDSHQLMRPLKATKIEQKKSWQWALAAATSLLFFTNRGNAQKKNNATTPITLSPTKNNSSNIVGKVACNHTSAVTIADTISPKNTECITGFDPTKNVAVMGLIIPAKVQQKVSWADTIPLVIQKVFNNEAFKVYPSPVTKGGNMHIAVKNIGEYTVQLFNSQSQLAYVEAITVTTEQQQFALTLPASLVAGNYYIWLINNETKKSYTDKIAVQ